MALKFLNSGYFAGEVGIGTVTNSDEDTNNGVPRLQVTTATAVLGEFPLAARFTTASDAGNNSGVSVLINSGNDRGLMISAGRQTGNVSKVTLNVSEASLQPSIPPPPSKSLLIPTWLIPIELTK